jgi:hypothetical protein
MREKPSTQIGHNSNRRSLDVIAAEIHTLMRRDVFEIGALLAEAREGAPGEHGAWQEWLEQFDFGYRTALNYLKAHDLHLKCEMVSLLKVPVTIIYGLADDLGSGDLSEADLKAVVAALDKACKTKPLTVDEANDIIWLVRARRKWGDLPNATLNAIDEVEFKPWAAAAIEELKQAGPETDEAADEIVKKHSVDPTREESAEIEEEDDNKIDGKPFKDDGNDPEDARRAESEMSQAQILVDLFLLWSAASETTRKRFLAGR